jgi:SAM-dependent methyltransferase
MKEANSSAVFNASSEQPFWSREYETVDQIWSRLHRTQTDFCFAQELSLYFTSKHWLEAERFIDVGTGNGYYLHRLAETFPEKDYYGVDINSVFIDVAKRSFGAENLQFECADLYDLEGQYEFLLMRLVMQHLTEPEKALKKIAELLCPGGMALVIDAVDAVRYYHPEPTEYVRFFNTYAAVQRQRGKDRDIAGKIPELVRQNPLLTCVSCETFLIPSTIPGNLALFEETYYLVIQLLEKSGSLSYDYEAVKRSWRNWCEQPRKYMQVGIRCVRLTREAS